MSADSAAENSRIIQMLEDLSTIYETTGLTIGEVRYFDTPDGTPLSIETNLGAESDLSQLFAVSADAPPGINVFMVSTIVKTEVEDESTGIVLGIAGGIPGPPFLAHGSPHSGVALSWDDTGGGESDELLGLTLAHELGHYLGLYHTVEQDGTTFDPIEDTSEDGSGNFMYWAYTGESAISVGQKFVMLRHPSVWLQTPTAPDAP